MNIRGLRKVIIILFFSLPFTSLANPTGNLLINNFVIKESLMQNDKLAILVCDSLGIPQENINGTFQFTINGFNYPLNFRDGVAITSNKIDNSTFVHLKHKNSTGTHSNLFYVLKKDNSLKIYKISWFYLMLIPIVLFVAVLLFKRFLWIAIILFAFYLYYNAEKGLNISSFFEIIIEGIKNFF